MRSPGLSQEVEAHSINLESALETLERTAEHHRLASAADRRSSTPFAHELVEDMELHVAHSQRAREEEHTRFVRQQAAADSAQRRAEEAAVAKLLAQIK